MELAVTLFLLLLIPSREPESERFPKELRAETLDNSRCFPGAYRRRGPSGFVSCGCSCLRAKWTTVDLTLDLSSLSLPPFLVLLSPSALTLSVCPAPSFLPPSPAFSHFVKKTSSVQDLAKFEMIFSSLCLFLVREENVAPGQ